MQHRPVLLIFNVFVTYCFRQKKRYVVFFVIILNNPSKTAFKASFLSNLQYFFGKKEEETEFARRFHFRIPGGVLERVVCLRVTRPRKQQLTIQAGQNVLLVLLVCILNRSIRPMYPMYFSRYVALFAEGNAFKVKSNRRGIQ